MLGNSPITQGAMARQPTPNSQQDNQLLGNPTLQSISSPYFNSSYSGPPSSFFIPSSIPAQNQQQPGQGGNIQQMVQALQGRGG